MGCDVNLGDIKIDQVKDVEIQCVKDVEIQCVKDVEVQCVKDVEIQCVKDVEIAKVAPIAAHIKEINNIDPLSVDAFNVTQVTNVDPLRVREFNVTNLPTVNVSLRQLPAVEVNLRRLPPVSVGFHQDFLVPSSYDLRLRFLGWEVARVALNGQTQLIPREKYRREQARTHERSYAEPAAGGNAAIPSHLLPKGGGVGISYGCPGACGPGRAAEESLSEVVGHLGFGVPAASFRL